MDRYIFFSSKAVAPAPGVSHSGGEEGP